MNGQSRQRGAEDLSRPIAEWRACYTRARHEKKVHQRLQQTGFKVFLPTVNRERQWHDRIKVVEVPLFPSYLFAHFGAQELGRVMSTAGVATVVKFQGRLASVPDREIENVRRLVAGLEETGASFERYLGLEQGDRVRVTKGPFEGVEGTVAQCRGRRVLVAGCETLGQGLKLELDTSLLEALT